MNLNLGGIIEMKDSDIDYYDIRYTPIANGKILLLIDNIANKGRIIIKTEVLK